MRRICNEKIQYEDEIKSILHDEFKNYCLKLTKDIYSYYVEIFKRKKKNFTKE